MNSNEHFNVKFKKQGKSVELVQTCRVIVMSVEHNFQQYFFNIVGKVSWVFFPMESGNWDAQIKTQAVQVTDKLDHKVVTSYDFKQSNICCDRH